MTRATDEQIAVVEKAYPFRWKALRGGRRDYGTRWALVCNQCDITVFKGSHAGRPVDERYFFHWASEAAITHQKICNPAEEPNGK